MDPEEAELIKSLRVPAFKNRSSFTGFIYSIAFYSITSTVGFRKKLSLTVQREYVSVPKTSDFLSHLWQEKGLQL